METGDRNSGTCRACLKCRTLPQGPYSVIPRRNLHSREASRYIHEIAASAPTCHVTGAIAVGVQRWRMADFPVYRRLCRFRSVMVCTGIRLVSLERHSHFKHHDSFTENRYFTVGTIATCIHGPCAAELYVHLPSRSRSPGQTFPGVLSDFQHCLELAATNSSVLISDSQSVFKSRLKTFIFTQAFTTHWSNLSPAPLKLRPYGAV